MYKNVCSFKCKSLDSRLLRPLRLVILNVRIYEPASHQDEVNEEHQVEEEHGDGHVAVAVKCSILTSSVFETFLILAILQILTIL
jgi:hypothetical protein